MKKVLKSVSLLVIFICLTKRIVAQDDRDALRYSNINITGTARSLSMAGAFGALGADFSTLSTNPAGIAFYRRSEFTITPALENRVTTTDYLGQSSLDNKYRFNLGNLGIVWAFPKEKKSSAWKGFAFGLGYNRLNSFHSRSFYQGVNTKNSLLDTYVEEAMGNDPNTLYDNYPFSSGLAYEAYAIDVYGNDTLNYFSVIPDSTIGKLPIYGELQRRTKETYGLTGEVVLSFGGNYNDKIYWGVTLGFPYIRYHEDVLYEETDPNKSIEFDSTGNAGYANEYNFKSYNLAQTLYTYGNGFNAKFGLIFRPVAWLRLGAAVHTPAWYNMHDEYQNAMTTSFENGKSYSETSPFGTFDYDLTTPWRAIGSMAFVYKNLGLLSLDYEFADYSTSKLDAYGHPFTNENLDIRNSYMQQHNIRAGIEYKYGIFSFRGGAGYSTGVLMTSDVITSDTDQHKYTYTGGLGIREEKYFVDLGYAYSVTNEYYQPYTLSYQPVQGAISKITDHKFLLTIGFRF